jgi:hypothetical protein
MPVRFRGEVQVLLPCRSQLEPNNDFTGSRHEGATGVRSFAAEIQASQCLLTCDKELIHPTAAMTVVDLLASMTNIERTAK